MSLVFLLIAIPLFAYLISGPYIPDEADIAEQRGEGQPNLSDFDDSFKR